MSKRKPQLLLDDILTSIAKIEQYIEGFTREQFLDDQKTIDAVVRNLEIIGEATRQLPGEYTAQHADVPWEQMAGLRNRIVHDYFGLDLDIIWAIIRNHLLLLKQQISQLVE